MGSILRYILFYLYYGLFFKKNKKLKFYKLFTKTQYYSKYEIEKLQEKKLIKLIRHAINNTSYYKNYKSISQIKDITKLPFLSKDDINKNIERLKANNISSEFFIKNTTSGSSGKKLIFYSYANNHFINAFDWRAFSWYKSKIWDLEIKIWGANADIKRFGFIKKFIQNFKGRIIIYCNVLNPTEIKLIIKKINKKRPARIIGYPSALFEIASYIKQNNIKIWIPKIIISTGELLNNWQKVEIEKTFNTKIYSFYGCREFGPIAYECPFNNGYHIMAENILLEVINKNGDPVYNQEGEIVITDLSNMAFPFIRYKIGDLGVLSNENCKCGINLPLLKNLTGRIFELIRLSNGSTINGTYFTILLKKLNGIKDFRIYQDKIDEITLEYIPEINCEIKKELLVNELKEISNNLLKVIFVKKSYFENKDSGKIQYIYSSL